VIGHMLGHVRSLWSRSRNQSRGRGSGHVLPSRVAPSQVHKSGDRLGNWSGDARQLIVIRWKNGVRTLHNILLEYKPGATNRADAVSR